ncbi:hypothetical protein M7I_2264 [Glarea lozoyensis 74030]|uniref:Uncharacterized protein n=1 Tax=Glarea lozoyensis (strain ATCC 74030 / MF5533) TaxID=1104152 RepID=H0EIB0_GLAL7|nr:hypothetical protein M7I_2264 [Glarea lozoyensis 74030]
MAPASMSRRRYNSSIHAPPDTSHSIEARKALRTHGLVPPVVESYELQAQRYNRKRSRQLERDLTELA